MQTVIDSTGTFAYTSPQSSNRIDSVLYLSGFPQSGDVAFRHALKIALANQGALWMLNVESNTIDEFHSHDFPSIRKTLELWETIPPASSKSVVRNLGLEVRKVSASGRDCTEKCLEFLEFFDIKLVVLAMQNHSNFMSWIAKSVEREVAKIVGQPTLFIPKHTAGFVSPADGSVKLKNILIPVNRRPYPEESLLFAKRLILGLEQTEGTVTLLHIGTSDSMPTLQPPQIDGWTWIVKTIPGPPADTIVEQANSIQPDLIVMTTDGPDRLLDRFWGTTSQRVLRQAECPVVVLPVQRELGDGMD